MERRPTLCIVAGPNGSGKTSTTLSLLADEWGKDSLYINPDNIAQEQFGDWNSADAVLKAAKESTRQRYECLEKKVDFVFETVFSSDEKVNFVKAAHEAGFFVRIFFVCTDSPEINVRRVTKRYLNGGHEVPISKIFSRYYKSIKNMLIVMDYVDSAYFYDNSVEDKEPRLLFRTVNGKPVKKYTDDLPKWAQALYEAAESTSNITGQTEKEKSPLNVNEIYCLGKKYYDEKEYKKAVYWFVKAANLENANAQYFLSLCYDAGKGVKQNHKQALFWCNKAAVLGHEEAQLYMGFSYEEGWNVRKNYKKAFYWFSKAAEQGNASAQLYLGGCYEDGQGTQKNITEALYWYRKAAMQGDKYAQYTLGGCYCYGKGVQQDANKSLYWYRKAAEQGLDIAQHELGCYYINIQDFESAFYWLQKAAEQGFERAKEILTEYGIE